MKYIYKTFRDFQVFVSSSKPEKEKSEITEILQKYHSTVIWECSFKTNIVEMKLDWKWFSCIADQVAGISLLRASDPLDLLNWACFYLCHFRLLKSENCYQKTDSHAF